MPNAFEQGLLQFYEPKLLSYLQSIPIGIAGVGGLGSNIAFCLVRSGFRIFELLDSDIIEASNLNRQQYTMDQIGQPKVQALVHNLKHVNPAVDIIEHHDRLRLTNSIQYFQSVSFLLEAFDQVDSKRLLVEAYGNSTTVLVCGSGMSGYRNTNPIQIRKVHNRLYIVGDFITEASATTPPFAPRVSVCAGLMASVVLEICMERYYSQFIV